MGSEEPTRPDEDAISAAHSESPFEGKETHNHHVQFEVTQDHQTQLLVAQGHAKSEEDDENIEEESMADEVGDQKSDVEESYSQDFWLCRI